MADRAELESLIRKADAAGDADAVRVLFEEMDKLDSAPAFRGPGAPASAVARNPYASAAPKMQQPDTWGGAVKNVAEAGGRLMSGAVASVASDVVGLAAIPADMLGKSVDSAMAQPMPQAAAGRYAALSRFNRPGVPARDPTELRDAIASAGTYQPSNPDSLSSKIVDAPGRMVGGASEYLTEQTGKLGIPYLDRFAGALPLAAANALGYKATKLGTFNARPYGGSATEALPKATNFAPPRAPVPTTEELTKASKAAYANAKESGVMVPAKSYGEALDSVRKMAKEEGLDPTLHPNSTAVMKRLEETAGKDLTLSEAETLRKIAMDAEDDLNPVTRQATPDARLAGKIVDELDDKIAALSTNNEARALWARSRKSQMIDQMIHRAEIRAGAHYTQAGMEHALRQEFKQLALNPRRMRGLTAEQRAAVEKVAKGGGLENSLRALGKFDPTTGGMAAFASIGTSAAAAPATGGLSAVLPLIGYGAKRAATRMTKTNVDLAREALVGRGIRAPQPAATTSLSPELARAMLSQGKTRSAAAIQADIDRLVQRAGQAGAPDSAPARAIWAELELLQAELASASKREAAQAAPGGQLNQ